MNRKSVSGWWSVTAMLTIAILNSGVAHAQSNTSLGVGALASVTTTGLYNTALGELALNADTTGSSNTATGIEAGYKNISGYNNTADGAHGLELNTVGSNNVAL